MSVKTSGPSLCEQERQEARELWEELMFAPSAGHLEAARQKLSGSPVLVQRAVVHVIAFVWQQGSEPQRNENPFA